MSLLRFERNGLVALGSLDGEEVVDLSAVNPDLPTDISALLRLGPAAMEPVAAALRAAPARARVPRGGGTVLAPPMTPGKSLVLGRNYVDHAAESGREKPDYPVVFMRCPTSFVGYGQPMLRPKVSEQLDFEGELVAFVGRRGRHVPRDKAHDIIAGYSVFNDGSVRDYQRRTQQWTMGKNFDATGGFGPAFVAADQLPPGAKGLKIQTRLNGQVVQDANTSDMVFDLAETISLLSACMTLEPGDLLVMGTPAGVGAARKPPLWMKPGDTCEVEIEGIGCLRNPIVQED
ncbi:MAG: fumarylacetoacetate hydrolase family protein [Thalassobaculum sp.]|uniref:fumarylacetoacetate hydrolase family protein n=1 Tax=Thalassobaculum sp. TaxID=2022740 RepID=UPI0032EADF8C